MIGWMNGHYASIDQLMISPLDHGFLYGLGFFETFRTYEGKPIFVEEHVSRLRSALAEFRIQLPYSTEELQSIVIELNHRNGGEDGYFRLNVSAGTHDIGLGQTSYTEPNVIIFRKPLSLAPRGTEKKAIWLKTKRNTPESDVRFKSHHYGNNVLARFEVPNLVEYEGFFCTSRGYVSEGITSNIFWAKGRQIFTPAIETGILPGITRRIVLHLAEVLEYQVYEGFFTTEDLEDAQECFITNSIQELVPISQIGHQQLAGQHGLVYEDLHRAYLYQVQKIAEAYEC